MKNRTRAGVVSAGVLVPVFALSAPAFADTTQQIVEGLSNGSHIYTSNGVSIPGSVSTEYSGENIALVYNEGASNAGRDASVILSQTDYGTVIVYSGNNYGAASDTGDGAAIATLLNESGNGIDALGTNYSEIKELSMGLTTSTETNPNVGAASDGVGLLGGAGIALGLALIATVGFLLVKRLLNRKSSVSEPKKILDEDYFANISKDLGAEVSELRRVIQEHSEKGLSLSAEKLLQVDKRLGDLFSRLSRKGTSDQVSIAAVKYQDLLKKIIFIMNEDHYMDVVLNPELWNRADQRKQSSLEAVEAVDDQILENIRQLNDSQDLEFNITLQALMTNGNNMNEIEELLFKNDDDSAYRTFGKRE